ncbi:MAG: penicillin-insensitive murein endopeptidase [Pararhizobium sp.]
MRKTFKPLATFGLAGAAALIATLLPQAASAGTPAKLLFGAKTRPAAMRTQSIGFYAKGCLAGAQALPITGPTWQVTRLSRNRNWGHPALIAMIEKLSRDAAKYDGWRGLLVGDMSQPRGGPMVNGHASHQVGLDADIWLTPMPDHVMSREERETMQFPSMIKAGSLELDPKTWTPAQGRLIMRAARDPEVERIFVAPGIKKRLCETWTGNRSILGKVRPYWGHTSHMHVRIACQPGSPLCKPQASVPPGDGCGKQLAWWFTDEPWKPAKPSKKPAKPPYQTQLSDLPAACRTVLDAPAAETVTTAAYQPAEIPAPVAASADAMPVPEAVPVPVPRPTRP